MKLTPWFEGTIKPVRVGVYRVDWPEYICDIQPEEFYSFWDGYGWGWISISVERAQKEYKRKGKVHDFGRLAWRGLAEDPNK